MNQRKLSEFIYTLDLENEEGMFGAWNLEEFFTRDEAMDYAESLARNNPEISVTIGIRPRYVKKNILRTS